MSSKNHPDDNIYSILGKLKSLEPTPAEVVKEKAQAIRESVEARGSIVDGVSQVQARLAEQFAAEEKWIQKAVNPKHKGDLHKALHVPAGEKIPQAKLDKAAHSKDAHVRHMAQFAKNVAHEDVALDEKAVSQAQQKFMGMAHAMQKGEKIKGASPELKKVAKTMKPSDTHDFAATKHKGLPKHVEEETCNECGMYESECGCDHDHVTENGLQRYTGIKKYGKEGFEALQKAGREGASEEEKGRIKDRYIKKEDMEEGQVVPVKGGSVHKGHYGYEVDPNADAPKKKSATGQRGRPKAEKPAEYSKTNDLFGRVPDKAPKGKKGHMVKGHATVAESIQLVESRILLEANFKRMAEEHGMTMDECMDTLNDHYKKYKMTGECSDFLRDCMDLRNHHKRMEMESSAPAAEPKPSMLDRAKQLGQKALDKFGHPSDEELLKDLERKTHPEHEIDEELNELARLAGLDVDEGNAFTGKLKDTPKGGEFELDGKTYKDTSNLDESTCNECGMYESQCSCTEGNLFTKKLKDTPKGGEFEIDGKTYKDTSGLDEVMKLAGLPVKETVKVDEPDEEPVNSPKPEYKSMKQSTMGPGEGDTGEKRMYPPHPAGDNGMTEPARKMPIKDGALKESTVELEARLAAEYESIKKVK